MLERYSRRILWILKNKNLQKHIKSMQMLCLDTVILESQIGNWLVIFFKMYALNMAIHSKGGVVTNMRSFLFTTAHNLVIDEYRKKKTVSLDALRDEGLMSVVTLAILWRIG